MRLRTNLIATAISIIFTLGAYAQCPTDIRINEFHYDNVGTDEGEFIEVRIGDPQPAAMDLSGYFIVLYNGSTPSAAVTYGSYTLDNAIVTSSGGYSYYVFNIAIQNGSNDGFALITPCGIQEVLSYEGVFTASNGPASMSTSVDVLVEEGGSTAIGQSLQLLSSGWAGPIATTKGLANEGGAPSLCSIDSFTVNTVGVCNTMTNMYDGQIQVYYTNPPTGNLVLNGQSFAITSSPQTINLLGLQSNGSMVTLSASFASSPSCAKDSVNAFTAPVACFDCSQITARINEFHYDDASGDEDEFVEIRIEDPQPFDLTQYTVSLYNGSGGAPYDTKTLDQFVANASLGFTYYTYDYSSIQNGPDAIALSGPCGLIEFISYEGSFVGVGGIADGITSTDIGVEEDGEIEGNSLQILGNAWSGPIPITKGLENEPFTDCLTPPQNLNANPSVVCVGSNVSLSVDSVANTTYQWSVEPAVGFDLTMSNSHVNIASTTLSGVYQISVVGTIHGCTSPASTIMVTVEGTPTVNAGPDLEVCSNGVVMLQGIGEGTWSGGAGVFSDVNDPNAIYYPDPSEENTTVMLLRIFSNTCGLVGEVMELEVVAPAPPVQLNCIANVNFSIPEDCILEITSDMVLSESNPDEDYLVVLYNSDNTIITQGGIIDRSMIGKSYKYSVFGPTPCNQNSCWGEILIEDKLPPTLTIPRDITIYCIESILPSNTGDATVTDCGPTSKYYKDQNENFDCTTDGGVLRIITRTWFATDDLGNIVSNDQKITVINLPDNLLSGPQPLVEVDCEEAYDPKTIADVLGITYGYPYYVNPLNSQISPLVDGGVCGYAATYVDGKKLSACGVGCLSSFKLVRTWTILNWCTATTTNYAQIIKVTDKTAPSINVVSPLKSYGTNAWSCTVDLALPIATVLDNCDDHAKIILVEGPEGATISLVNGIWRAYDVPKGMHTFTYYAEDCCGNQSTATVIIAVEDRNGPVATAKEYITLSLTRSANDTITALAKVTPDMIDNGSYDNCSGVYLEIRRETGAPKCLNEGDFWNHDNNVETPRISWNNNVTYNDERNAFDQSNPIHENDRIFDTDDGKVVSFCCEDLTTGTVDIDSDGKNDVGYHKVWLRVWDDADMNGIFGSDGDLYNETWTIVKLEDNIVPIITCEVDVTAYCDEDLGKLNLSNDWKSVDGNVPTDWLPWVDAACVYQIEYKDVGSVNTCNIGNFVRTYRVAGGKNKDVYVTCTQNIEIALRRNGRPRLDWPISLHTWNKCELSEEDVLNNTIKAAYYNYLDVVITEYVPYLAYEWFETGYNTPNLGLYCLDANNNLIAEPETGTNGLTPIGGGLTSDLENKTRFNPNWRNPGCSVFGRKIIIEEYNVGEGCKKWIVKFEYIDWCNPDWAACVSTIYKYEDETPPTIEVSMSDTIAIDANCLASWVTNPKGLDDGGCEAGYRWIVTIQTGGAGLVQTGTGNNPKLTFSNVPVGKWTVHYKLTDGCGNVTEKDAILVVLGKAPTPYCISLSSAVMKNGTVELWARDFDKNSFDNCIDGPLYFTFDNQHPVLSKLAQVHYFKGNGQDATETEYINGDAQKWLPDLKETKWPNGDIKIEVTGGTSGRLFGCKVGNGSTFPIAEIKMTVWDRDLRSDYCLVTLSLIDNQNVCAGGGSVVTLDGFVKTENGTPITGASINLDANIVTYSQKKTTDNAGKFSFQSLPIGLDYEVKVSMVDQYRNGVNTLDLVHIQRHILALEKLQSPYKIIAADANSDGKINVSDLTELRKLILGITDKLDQNQSWRFVDATQQMEENPFPFVEKIAHSKLLTNVTDNFIGMKIGDVDGSAKMGLNQQASLSSRQNGLMLITNDRFVQKGEDFIVSLKTNKSVDIYGFQGAFILNGLEITGVEGRVIDFGKHNYATPKPNLLTTSWSTDRSISVNPESTLVELKIKALTNGQLSQMLAISDEVLNAEVYIGHDLETADLKLEFRNGLNNQYALEQNEPNPWRGETRIHFELPRDGKVTFTIMDITGRLIYKNLVEGHAGKNAVTLTKAEVGKSSGLLIYKVECNDFSMQRKMIVLE